MRSTSPIAVAITVLVSGCVPSVAPSPAAPVRTPSTASSAPARSAAPDFDGDGQADLVVGLGTSIGRVRLHYGDGHTQDLTRADLDGSASAGFGQGLLARDLNVDGYTDLVIGDPDLASERGPAIFLLDGGPDGTPSQFFQGEVFGGVRAGKHVGSPVSSVRTGEDEADTLVIAARGEAEEGVLGSVWTLRPPYGDAAETVIDGVRVHEELGFALSPPPG